MHFIQILFKIDFQSSLSRLASKGGRKRLEKPHFQIFPELMTGKGVVQFLSEKDKVSMSIFGLTVIIICKFDCVLTSIVLLQLERAVNYLNSLTRCWELVFL